MAEDFHRKISIFDQNLFRKIYKDNDLTNKETLSIDVLVQSLKNKNAVEFVKALKQITINRSYKELTKEEFLAFYFRKNAKNNLNRFNLMNSEVPEKIMNDCQNFVMNMNKKDDKKRYNQTFDEYKEKKLHAYYYKDKSLKDMITEFHRVMVDTGDDTIIPVKKDDPTTVLSKSTVKQLISGGIAGIVSRTATAPLDRIKIFMQVEACKKDKIPIQMVIKRIYGDNGLVGFWRSNGINCMKIGPEYALRFAFYDFFKKNRLSNKTHSSLFDKFLCGSLAGTTSQFLIYPMEVIKTRVAVSSLNEYSGLFDAIYKISSKEGYASFYRGIIPCLVGAFPYNGINLSVYESIKYAYSNYYLPHKNDTSPSIGAIFLASSIAACAAQFATYPLVVIRTNMQVYQRPGKLNISHDIKYMSKLCKDIYKTNGVRGFYRGIWPNFIKVLPSVALSFVIYEKVLAFLQN